MKRKFGKKPIPLIALIIALCNTGLYAQQPLTLKECIRYSLTNNSNIRIANYNFSISKEKVNEQVGTYLPQINISGELDNNLKLVTQLMPAEMMGGTSGTYIPVTFGNKYSVSGGIQLTQKLYDPASFLMIKSARINKNISDLTRQQTNELTEYNISLVYYQTLVIQMQRNVLKSNLFASEKSLKSIELKYSNGMAKKIDVDKIRVNYNNIKSQLEQSELSYSQSLNTLKYNMGMPLDSTIILADTTIDASYSLFIEDKSPKFQLDNVYDYRLKQANISLMQMDRKTKKAAFQPTLSFFGNYNYNAMRQEFSFFEVNQDWYPNSAIGLKLSIPIFDGMQRNSKLAQSELNVKVSKENLWLTEQSIKVDISNSEIQYKNALDNISRERDNLALAESVYQSSQLEYQQGASSTLDLIQAESSYMVSQNTYFNKLLDLYIARLTLEKARGNLIQFVNNLNN
jgi:outer membrane protein TolC